MTESSIFQTEPKGIAVAQAAWEEFLRYRMGKTRAQAVHDLLLFHLAHVGRIVKSEGIEDTDSGFFVTDIPDYDLSVVDAHFPALHQRHVSLTTRARAVQLTHLIQADLKAMIH